jgi:competence transcription factor ComK
MKYFLLIIMIINCDSCICCYYKLNKDKVVFKISAIQRSNSYFSFNLLIKNNDSNAIAFITHKRDTIFNNLTQDLNWELLKSS